MSRKEIYSAGHITAPPFLLQPCSIEATLIERVWGKHVNLICIFESNNGVRFSATAWRHWTKDHEKEIYAPRETEIDFAEVDNDTRWRCSFKMSPRKTHTIWLSAEQI